METRNGIQIDDFSVQVRLYKDGIKILDAVKSYPTLNDAKEATKRWRLNIEKKYGTKRGKYQWRNLRPYDSIEYCDCQVVDMYAKYDIRANKSVVKGWIFSKKPQMQFNFTMTHRREVVFDAQRKIYSDFEKCNIPPLRKHTDITINDIKRHIAANVNYDVTFSQKEIVK